MIASRPAVALYFTSPNCAVCHALKPKLLDAIASTFDDVELISVDTSESPEISSQFGVFAVPTVLVFFDGKEFIRRTRNMRVEEVIDAMRRPYEVLMS
jgi:thioredoxin